MKPELGAFGPAIGWALAVAAVAVGYMQYGWPGVFLAFSVVVFWLLLQFSRALRAMRTASGRPVGRVDNAVMLHAKLRTGLRLVDILKLTRSLGTVVAAPEGSATAVTEVFCWQDDGGDQVEVELQAGRVTRWALQRARHDEAAA
jgi:hypothetical protein